MLLVRECYALVTARNAGRDPMISRTHLNEMEPVWLLYFKGLKSLQLYSPCMNFMFQAGLLINPYGESWILYV